MIGDYSNDVYKTFSFQILLVNILHAVRLPWRGMGNCSLLQICLKLNN